MSRFWSPVVHHLKPYTPGEQPKILGLVKLNTNENPYGPSPRALAAIARETTDALRLYPDPVSLKLREEIATRHGVDPSWVFAGNGSDEILAFTFQALLKQDAPLLTPDIGYSFYPVYCGLYGIELRRIPLTAQFQIDIDDYRMRCGGVILANPNAPTGCALPRAAIAELARAHPDRVVAIDEAYVDFGGESAIKLVSEFPNLLVIQTFSKSRSLAGLRVGFAVGQRPLIEGLERVKDSFNSYPLDRLASAGAVAALQDEAWFEETRGRIISARADLERNLKSLEFEVAPSRANFLLARHPAHRGLDLLERLRERKILVRNFQQPRIEDFLRITIGTEQECAYLIETLRSLI